MRVLTKLYCLLLVALLIPSGIQFSYAAEAAGENFPIQSRDWTYARFYEPIKNVLSGSSAMILQGLDPRLSSKEQAERQLANEARSPVLQAAAAALVPYRSATQKFSRNLLITRDLGGIPLQTEPHIAIDPKDPDHIVVGLIDYNSPNVVTYVSIDAGQTWDGPFQPRYPQEDVGAAGDPVVAFDRMGNTYAASITVGFEEFSIGGIAYQALISSISVSKSVDGGQTWQRPVTSSRSGVKLRLTPPDEQGVGGFLALEFLDKPWMVVGPDPLNTSNDMIVVSYTKFTTRFKIVYIFRGEFFFFADPVVETAIETVVSRDGGISWSDPRVVSPVAVTTFTTPLQKRTVQGSNLAITPDGTLLVSWLDSTDDDAFKGLAEIWASTSSNAGKSFSEPVKVASFLEPSFAPRTGFFRAWGSAFPQTAVAPDGTFYIAFVARPPNRPTDDGDVYIVKSLNKGRSWSRPVRVNDDQTDRFQFFPSITVDKNGVIHAMWGDFRDDRTEKAYHIYYSRSEDKGDTWLENSRVTDFPSNPNRGFPSGLFIGDYFSIKAAGSEVYMVWADTRLGELGGFNQKIGFARISPMPSPTILISPPSGAGGKDVIIQGFNFQPEQEIFIEVSGAIVGGGRTSQDGRFTVRMFMPISAAGPQDVRVIEASGNVATASFYVDFGFDTLKKLGEVQEKKATAEPSNVTTVVKAEIPPELKTQLDNIAATQSILNSEIRSVSGALTSRGDDTREQVASIQAQISALAGVVSSLTTLVTISVGLSLITLVAMLIRRRAG